MPETPKKPRGIDKEVDFFLSRMAEYYGVEDIIIGYRYEEKDMIIHQGYHDYLHQIKDAISDTIETEIPLDDRPDEGEDYGQEDDDGADATEG